MAPHKLSYYYCYYYYECQLPSRFKLSVQNVHLAPAAAIHDWSLSKWQDCLINELPVTNHSISIARQFSAWQCWSVLTCISDSIPASCPTHEYHSNYVNSKLISVQDLNMSELFLCQHRSLISCLLLNARLSLHSYNFWMQLNIAMKFARYVARILLHCKFGEKITTISDISNFS